MSYERLEGVIGKLNVNSVKGDLTVSPELNFRGEHDIVSVMCFSDDKNYIMSLVHGMSQYFGFKPEIKSEVKLTTPQEFFRPTKPQQHFHYTILSKEDLLKVCARFDVSFDDLKEECRPKINPYPYKM